MSEKTHKILLVNTGRCTLSNDKEGYQFIEVTSEAFKAKHHFPEIQKRWVFGKSITKHLGPSPGMVFEIEVKGNSVIPTTAYYKGLWPDEDLRAQWKIKHQTLGQKFQLEAQKKKDKRLNAFEHKLKPIRDAYRSTRGLQRSLILAHVVRFITS